MTEPLLPAGDPTLLSNRKWFPPFIPSSRRNLTGFRMKPVSLSSSLTTCFSHRTAGNSLHLRSFLPPFNPSFHFVWTSSARPPLSLLLSHPPSVQAQQTAQQHVSPSYFHTQPPSFPHSHPPPPSPVPSPSPSAWHVAVPNLESVHYLFRGGK